MTETKLRNHTRDDVVRLYNTIVQWHEQLFAQRSASKPVRESNDIPFHIVRLDLRPELRQIYARSLYHLYACLLLERLDVSLSLTLLIRSSESDKDQLF